MLFIVIPVYNEEQNIKYLMDSLRQNLKDVEYKIVAVNDGSQDSSLKLLEGLQTADLVIISSLINMNVGAVFSAGIDRVLQEANDNDILIIMEGDQTSDVKLIKLFVEEINKGQDIVIGSRHKLGGAYVNFPFLRRVFSFGANWMMQKIFPITGVKDYTIFFRAYRTRILNQAVKMYGKFGLIQSKGFVANAELLIKLSLLTNNIEELPLVYNYGKKKGASKINVFRTINEYFVLVNYMKRIFVKVKAVNKI
ncbi:MAG: glycosyltransferase [Candidatus Omnitrophica bacterium]|nr:glycosyltransferase [Candidatus Omnitrophota bacterium]